MTGNRTRGKPILQVRGLHKSFGDHHVLKGVSLNLRPGEVVVIMGPSGSGKSTFLRCLNFLEDPTEGSIEIAGVEINAEEPAKQRKNQVQEIRRQAALIFQDFNLFPHMTVLENIITGAVQVKGVPKQRATAKAEALLAEMGLLGKRDVYPARLAAGEQQQVAIARSLCMEPKILLFDNPTSALDASLVVGFAQMLVRLADQGIALIVVTNEPYVARKAADRVILMDQGAWVEIAPPDLLFSNPKKARTRQFLRQIPLKDIGAEE